MRARLRLPSTTLLSLLAALTTWLTMTTWAGFSERPSDFLQPLAIGCALVAVTGALLRSARLHPALVVMGQLVVLGLWLNHRFAADAALAGWLPTADSIRACLDVLSASTDAAQSYAAPVPDSVPEFPPILITLGGGLAVLVDLLACGARRVPLAGLPLLAMYTAPVSMLESGVPWWKFALIAVTFLALLAAEEAGRLAHWGRDLGLVEARHQRWRAASNRTVWPSARKIGLTATAMAVVVPVFVPTIAGGVLDGMGNGPGGGGDGVRITNPMLNLKRDFLQGPDVPALQVTTDDPNPGYMRIAVLDEYTGFAWRPSERDIPIEHRVDGELPLPEGLDPDVTATPRQYSVRALPDFDSRWLPLPYPTLRLDIDGDWRYDPSTMDVVSAVDGKTTADVTYTLEALDVQPTAEDLLTSSAVPNDLFRRYTQVDADVESWVAELAEQVTAAGTNKAERAVLLQNWFTQPHTEAFQGKNFDYSLANSGAGSGMEDLEDFLQNSRTGYCEQFATSMALMARTLGIPARVAVGFLRPDTVGIPGSDSYEYSRADMHAWPELYFGGVGWVRFEPTPSSRQGAEPPLFSPELLPEDDPTAAPTSTATTPSPTDTSTFQPTDRPTEEDPVVSGGGSDGGGRPWLLVTVLLLLVAGTLAALPRTARSLVRSRRWAAASTAIEQAEAAWTELRDSFVDHRLAWNEQDTVRQRAAAIVPLFRRRPGPGEEHLARVVTSSPEAEAALDRILHFVERSRYARTVPEVDDIRRDVELCVDSVRLGLDPDVRRKATWLPVSLVKRSRRGPVHDSGLAALSEPSLSR
ncbi:MAG TPA: DUF3488 and transglutaminase-like domain-containing protein [Nocardioidaceae bacterium]|nr:DUF3488 and transglutaminase-like domain-containing protein [Nocardioidaceae bacterium]